MQPWVVREGRNETVWPGLTFVRWTRPGPMPKGSVHSLSVAFVVSGRKRARVGGRDYEYDASHYFMLTTANELTAYVVEASDERPYLAMVLELPPALVAKTLTALAEVEPGPASEEAKVPAYVARIEPQLLSAASRFLQALETNADRRILAPLVLEEICYRLLTSPHAQALRRAAGAARDGQQILEAMEWMRRHAAEPLSVPRIARKVGMSASHFAHCFTEVARTSPMRYLKRVRLELAQQLLLGSALRAAEVAGRVGYQSVSHFTRDFKAEFGVPPGQFARRFAEADA